MMYRPATTCLAWTFLLAASALLAPSLLAADRTDWRRDGWGDPAQAKPVPERKQERGDSATRVSRSRREGLSRQADSKALEARGVAPLMKPSRDSRDSASVGSVAPPDAGLDSLRDEIRTLASLIRERVVPPDPQAQAAPHAASLAAVPAASSANPAVPAAPVPAPVAAPVPTPVQAAKVPPAPDGAFDLKADIQIQGERRLTSASHRDNLDDFWGRLNFGAEYKGRGFQSKANVRLFPEGFGFEPLTGATFDTSGQGALKTQSQPAARVVVNHAWARFEPGPVHVKVGRFETQESHSLSYGNYIDLGPSGRFLARPASHNALETGFARGPHATTALVGTGDRRLNRGFLRLLHRHRSKAGLDFALGYRANLFDRLQFPKDEVLQRFDANLLVPLPRGFTAFAEAAALQVSGRDDDIPVLVGLRPPTGPWLDLVSLEAEWLADRKAGGRDKPLLFNLHARKSFGRARFEASLFSDAADRDADAFGLGLRMTSTLK